MRWSYSASRSFKQCQRQWYFKNIVASSRSKDPFRLHAYQLSKRQSIHAWRGKIVDDVISKVIVPSLNRRSPVSLRIAKAEARDRFQSQLESSRTDGHPIDASAVEEPIAIYGLEFGIPPTEAEIEAAWTEIEAALTNLYAMDEVKDLLRGSEYVVAQRALQFAVQEGVSVLAYPDAIAFQPGGQAAILDWKVHAFGQNDAWLQLAIYAIALSNCNHKDFPQNGRFGPCDYKLLEVQLLTNSVRYHELTEDHVADAEDYISASAYEIACLVDGKKYEQLQLEDFQVAIYPQTCQRCPFREICWEQADVH